MKPTEANSPTIEMKQHPILFSTPMVQAIMKGSKAQTRRIKGLELVNESPSTWRHQKYGGMAIGPHVGWKYQFWDQTGRGYLDPGIKCPYGQVGDVLWVRETWRKHHITDTFGETHFDKPAIIKYAADRPEPVYEVDGDGFQVFNKDGSEKFIPWRPSIFMPKAACRLYLQITDIRVERLQDISEEDAKAEGVQPNCDGAENCPSPKCKATGCQSAGEYYHYMRDFEDFPAFSAKESFESLWEKINGAESWEANPWVWVISFKKIDNPNA